MSTKKWKTKNCADSIINELSNSFPVEVDIIDDSIKSITLYPTEFPRGLRIIAKWESINLATRAPLRVETQYKLSWTYHGVPGSSIFSTETEAETWRSTFVNAFITEPPEVTLEEIEIEIYDEE